MIMEIVCLLVYRLIKPDIAHRVETQHELEAQGSQWSFDFHLTPCNYKEMEESFIWTLGQSLDEKWGKESERVFRKLWFLMTSLLLHCTRR